MIREYGPIALIPAAWIMTFATMVYPGLETYWIQHMHYFMLVFLTGFTLFSWKEMGENIVLDVWRKVIGAGVLFTGFGALSFHTASYTSLLAGLSLGYWLLAPGIGCYFSAREMNRHNHIYRRIGVAGYAALISVFAGIVSGNEITLTLGILLAAVSQTYSILIAAKLDENL